MSQLSKSSRPRRIFTGGGSDLHGGAAADIAGREDAGHTGVEMLVGHDEADLVEFDRSGFQKLRIRHQADEHENAIGGEFNLFAVFGAENFDHDVVFTDDFISSRAEVHCHFAIFNECIEFVLQDIAGSDSRAHQQIDV